MGFEIYPSNTKIDTKSLNLKYTKVSAYHNIHKVTAEQDTGDGVPYIIQRLAFPYVIIDLKSKSNIILYIHTHTYIHTNTHTHTPTHSLDSYNHENIHI